MKFKTPLLVVVTLIAASGVASAKTLTAKDGAKVFIIQSKEKPARVLPADKAADEHGVMMRMPNLDASSVVSVPDSGPDAPKSKVGKKPQSRGGSRIVPSKKQGVTTLKFSRSKIQGALRMPRVKFSKVGPSVDIREEIPDLDFSAKTLKDSDF